MEVLTPVENKQRFHSMDLIRGVAVLGILIMNIYAFANIFSYYMNPYALGETSSTNVYTWLTTHILADQKFYTIFSMLFGAGIMLMAEKAQHKGISAASTHYKRMAWLLVFGLIHGIFIWFGDILVTYAITGMWVYGLALKTKPRTKIIIGSILILSLLALFSMMAFNFETATAEDKEMFIEMFSPDATFIAEESATYLAGYSEQLNHRINFLKENLAMSVFLFGIFRIGGGMLLGMAFYQLGIFTAEKSKSFYWKFSLISLIAGFSLLAYDSVLLLQSDFALEPMLASYLSLNSLASLFVAFGYIGLLCLWFKSDAWQGLRLRFEAVGQMAFTNYIAHSIICTFIFYSYGLGLFAELERYQLYYIVAAIFVAQLVYSKWWLERYHFGPLEWLWRSLTYSKKQPFKKVKKFR